MSHSLSQLLKYFMLENIVVFASKVRGFCMHVFLCIVYLYTQLVVSLIPSLCAYGKHRLSRVSALARNMATSLQRLCQNHRRRQEVGLLCGLYNLYHDGSVDSVCVTYACCQKLRMPKQYARVSHEYQNPIPAGSKGNFSNDSYILF